MTLSCSVCLYGCLSVLLSVDVCLFLCSFRFQVMRRDCLNVVTHLFAHVLRNSNNNIEQRTEIRK